MKNPGNTEANANAAMSEEVSMVRAKLASFPGPEEEVVNTNELLFHENCETDVDNANGMDDLSSNLTMDSTFSGSDAGSPRDADITVIAAGTRAELNSSVNMVSHMANFQPFANKFTACGAMAGTVQNVQPKPMNFQGTKERPLICYIFDPRTWFNPNTLDPKIETLIYWRNTRETGIIFGTGVVLLMMLSCLSVISVISHLSLAVLTAATVMKLYAKVFRLTGNDCPLNKYFGTDWNLAPERTVFTLGLAVKHFNFIVSKLRDLILVKNFGNSMKFGMILIGLTYIGAWFNGVTILLMAYIALFSMPKLYEKNKQWIHEKFGMIWYELQDMCTKLASLMPEPEHDVTVYEDAVMTLDGELSMHGELQMQQPKTVKAD